MQRVQPLSALVVGSITRDFIAGEAHPLPGGVVFHAGCALARLGARVRVVTRVRAVDAPALVGPLDAEQVETLALDSRETTTYGLDYRGAVDAHELLAASDPIRAEDIPEAWRRADLVHLGPLHRDDLDPDVPAVFEGLVGLDVQGLVRVPGERGTQVAPPRELDRYLSGVGVLKASEHELPVLLDGGDAEAFRRRHAISELLVTHGARGCTLITADGVREIPALAGAGSATVGAGDVFLAAYLLLRSAGRDPLAAAREATVITAAKIRHGQVPKGLPLGAHTR